MVVILSESAIPALRMTVDEYLEADLPEGYRYELNNGAVEMASMPGGEHDACVTYLSRLMERYRDQHPGAIAHLSQRAGVAIPGSATVRGPDLALYQRWEGRGRGAAVWKEFTPFLVVEVVSTGQADRDLVEKRKDYWTAGVEEYWVADPDTGRLTVFRRGATAWEEETFDQPQATYAPARLPGLEIRIGALFGV